MNATYINGHCMNQPFEEVVKCYNSLLSHPCVLMEREDFRMHTALP